MLQVFQKTNDFTDYNVKSNSTYEDSLIQVYVPYSICLNQNHLSSLWLPLHQS